ncbi:MAG: hypothetical protein Q7S34_04100 [bacterium]|nr:hypothetical protein [bacterium]
MQIVISTVAGRVFSGVSINAEVKTWGARICVRPVDPTKEAWVEVESSHDFGRGGSQMCRYLPAHGWVGMTAENDITVGPFPRVTGYLPAYPGYAHLPSCMVEWVARAEASAQ